MVTCFDSVEQVLLYTYGHLISEEELQYRVEVDLIKFPVTQVIITSG